jgi:hypothetical protein
MQFRVIGGLSVWLSTVTLLSRVLLT